MLTTQEVVDVLDAIDRWSNLTCVTFEQIQQSEQLPDTQHLIFTNEQVGARCGRSSVDDVEPPQGVEVNEARWAAAVWKSLGISLGMHREQNSVIRDTMVIINYDNVYPGYEAYFDKLSPTYYTVHDVPYDYGSLFHEKYNWLAKQENAATIVPMTYDNYKQSMGQNMEISHYDAMWINRAYCDDVCPDELPCENGGYTDPKDCSVCRCPDGYAGVLCNQLSPGSQDCSPTSGEYEFTKQNFQYCVSSPNFNKGKPFTAGDTCTWRFKAPSTCTVKVWSANRNGYLRQYDSGWCGDWLEIKYLENHEIRGERWCGANFQDENKRTSDWTTVMALFRSFPKKDGEGDQYFKGFALCFSVEDTDCLPVGETTVGSASPTTADSGASTGFTTGVSDVSGMTDDIHTSQSTDKQSNMTTQAGTSTSTQATTETKGTGTDKATTGGDKSTTHPSSGSTVSVSSPGNVSDHTTSPTMTSSSYTSTEAIKDGNKSSGSNSGAVAAIVIVLIVGLIVLGLLFAFVFWKTRPRDPNANTRKVKVAPQME